MKKKSKKVNVKKLTKHIRNYKRFNQNEKQIIEELTQTLSLDFKLHLTKLMTEEEF